MLRGLITSLHACPRLRRRVRRYVSSQNRIVSHTDDGLDSVHSQLGSAHDSVRRQLRHVVRHRSNTLRRTLVARQNSHFILPIGTPRGSTVPNLIRSTSTDNTALCVRPRTVIRLNGRLHRLLHRRHARIRTILHRLARRISRIRSSLRRLLTAIALLSLTCTHTHCSL